jgi:hypothetical protein
MMTFDGSGFKPEGMKELVRFGHTKYMLVASHP